MEAGSTPEVSDPYAGIKLPDPADMQLQLEKLVQQGVMTPEDAQAALAQASDLNNISTDPSLKSAQMDALSGLQDISKSGGLTASDRAKLGQIKTDEDTSARGSRDAILQNAQARGVGGSGLELLAQLKNQQDSATRTSARDMDVAGMAQDRALQALIQAGTTAGSIQNQDFNQQATVANANDAISKFNAQNQQTTNLANTTAHNTAQASNLANKQAVANANVGTNNQQQQYNKQLAQQNFDNEVKKAGGTASVNQANQQAAGQNSQNDANAWNQTVGTVLGTAGTVGAAYAGGGAKAKKDGGLVDGEPTGFDSEPHMLQPGEVVLRKQDVPDLLTKAHTGKNGDLDVAALLDTITGHKYGYKKKGRG